MSGVTDDGVVERFTERVERVEADGDVAVTGAAHLDRGLVLTSCGRFADAVRDFDRAGDSLRASGYGGAAAVAAAAGCLSCRLAGDVHGAVGRAQFARAWAPVDSAAAAFAHLNAGEAALAAGDRAPAADAFRGAAEVGGDGALPANVGLSLSALADDLMAPRSEPITPTPVAEGQRAADVVLTLVEQAIIGAAPVDSLEDAYRESGRRGDLTGLVSGALTAGVLRLRLRHTGQAILALADAALAGRPLRAVRT